MPRMWFTLYSILIACTDTMHLWDDFMKVFYLLQPVSFPKIVSEYDQEIPQSQTADNPVAPRGRAAQPSQDTRKTNQAKQSALSSPSRWLQY